ncbi:MAG TPA: DNA polymerase I [Candidatus Saccharimonadia bacterium]|jgi:DNA polymerase-1
MKRPLLVLVDGSAVFHRGYHAIPHLSNSKGEPTNAVYGFLTIMIKVLGDLKPEYVIVAWDKSSKTFRNDMYADYKATRTAMDDDLRVQIAPTKELVKVLGLPLVEVENYEADDIIGTLARKAEAQGNLEVVIATGDRDQLQLVDENTVVAMFNPRGLEPTRYDLAKMKEKYGLTPQQFVDYKALVGDTSDNIPGVKGIGDKGAQKLLAEYGSLDGIYEHLDEINGKVGEYLREGRELAFLSRELSKIICDMPLELDLEEARVGQHDHGDVREFFSRMSFRSNLLEKLPAAVGGSGDGAGAAAMAVTQVQAPTLFDDEPGVPAKARPHLNTAKYRAVTSPEQLDELVVALEREPVFAFDTETTDVDTTVAELVGISVSFKDGEAYYVPVGHTQGTQLDSKVVTDRLKAVFENPKIGKVGHNAKFDYEMLRKYGITVAPIVFDTMIAAFLLDPLSRSQSLDDLAFRELGVEMIPISDLIGKGKSEVTFDKCLIEDATTYAGEDADMSFRLYRQLKRRLEVEQEHPGPYERWGDWNMWRLAEDIEWPIIPVLGEMERDGIELDTKRLAEFGAQLTKKIGELKGDIYAYAGEEFNLGSPAQLGQVLYGRLGLSTAGLKKGKTGWSTAVGELEKLRQDHPVVELIMQFRELDKLKNTYVDALPGQVAPDGRVHTSFSQVVAQTGRLSSSNPNLMNIPVRTELGREIRTCFVAPAGRVLVSADYSQIELRVAAALSGDEAMIETFRSGTDLHRATAAELYGVPLEDVTKEQRSAVKAINFGVLYGMSAHGLSVATGMEGKEAAAFIERYFEVRPRLREYIDATKKFAWDNQYTATLFGRRRPCPEIRSSNYQIRQATERMAVNVPIQGTAADIYKLAMVELAARLDEDCRLLLQIHDELIVEAPAHKGQEVAKLMQEVMGGVIDLGVPLAVDTGIGKNWGELK